MERVAALSAEDRAGEKPDDAILHPELGGDCAAGEGHAAELYFVFAQGGCRPLGQEENCRFARFAEAECEGERSILRRALDRPATPPRLGHQRRTAVEIELRYLASRLR